jgi:hypothetical protein
MMPIASVNKMPATTPKMLNPGVLLERLIYVPVRGVLVVQEAPGQPKGARVGCRLCSETEPIRRSELENFAESLFGLGEFFRAATSQFGSVDADDVFVSYFPCS